MDLRTRVRRHFLLDIGGAHVRENYFQETRTFAHVRGVNFSWYRWRTRARGLFPRDLNPRTPVRALFLLVFDACTGGQGRRREIEAANIQLKEALEREAA